MIKSKRIIALLLSVLITLTMVMPTVVFAEEAYPALSLNVDATISMPAGDNVSNTLTFTPEKDGKYIFYFYGEYDFGVAVYASDNMEMPIVTGMDSYDIKAELSKDVTYYVKLTSYGQVAEAFDIGGHVVEAPTVTSLTINKFPDAMEVYEGTLENYEFYGLHLIVEMSDGSERHIYDGMWAEEFSIDYYVETDKNSKDYGKVTITVEDKTVGFNLEILENPVAKIEYIGEGVTFIEGTFGGKEIDQNDQEYYYYYFDERLHNQGEVIKITYKDGTVAKTKIWSSVDKNYYVEAYADQYKNHWTKGGKNYITVNYLGNEAKVPVNIVETPIKSIKIDNAPTYVYTYGESYYGWYNGETYNLWPTNFEGLKFTVNYKDGSQRTFVGEDIDEYRLMLEGESFDYDFASDDVKIGKNKVEISYCGVSASYDITVKESNIKSIEATKASDVKTYNNYFLPDFEGAEFTVTFNDNTKKIIKFTKDNMVLEGSGVSIVEDEKYIANIDRYYEEENVVFRFSYLDKTCDIDYMKYVEDEYLEIDVKNINYDFENVEVIATTADGKKETYKLTNDFVVTMGGYGDMDIIIPVLLYTDTPKGVLESVGEIHLSNGIPVKYTVSTLGCYWEKEVNTDAKLQSISVDHMPKKVKYEKGEKFDAKGLIISLDYGNGVIGYVEYGVADITLSAVDTKTLGKKTVTVTYMGKTTTFAVEVTEGFADVKKGSWYQEYVNYAAKYGIFAGTDETKNTFSPDMTMTRAQIVQIFANIEGINTDNGNVDAGFKDVAKGKWYTAAVKWAAENGIVNGTGDGNFKPNDAVTREQLCVMVENYIEGYAGSVFMKKVAGITFKDDAKISSWAKEAVYKCQRAGIISGTGDGNFAPLATANRAQGATIFAEFHSEYLSY